MERGRDNVLLDRDRDSLGARSHTETAAGRPDVVIDRANGQAKGGGNLRGRLATRDPLQTLSLAGCEFSHDSADQVSSAR